MTGKQNREPMRPRSFEATQAEVRKGRRREKRYCRVCGGDSYLPPETDAIEDNGRKCPYCDDAGNEL